MTTTPSTDRPPAATHPRARTRRESGFRPEIQALRAAAVALVVAYHVWPERIPGGFVGVDVFFVVSGFLITSHLVTGFDRDGRVSLPAFWARRARRLLPASLLVLAATALGTLVILPAVQWQQAFREILGSALYVQNWVLAADSVDYLAAENSPSPVQHFWSLSVEEQFYVVVPILLSIAALLAGRRADAVRRRRILALTLGVVTVASLAFSIWLTATDPGPAYFVTPTRAWEFAAGGLLAFAAGWVARRSDVARATAGWLGWIGLAVSAFVITGATPFPGIAAALPVVATLLIIAAGRPAVPWASDRLVARQPVILVGDISYAIYLWHWPALVFAWSRLGRDLPAWLELALVGVVLVVSWLSTRLVEDPIRRLPALTTRRPTVTFAATLAAMALVAVPVGVGWSAARQAAVAELEEAAAVVLEAGDCIGAGSRDPALSCPPTVPGELVPDPSAAIDDKSSAYAEGCISGLGIASVPKCTAGVPDGSTRVLVVGDSHAAHWLPAFQAIAAERDWAITTFFKSACSLSTTEQVGLEPQRIETCADWNREVASLVAEGPPFDLVFVSASIPGNVYPDAESATAGFRAAWSPLTARGSQVVVLRDTPRVPEDTAACLERSELEPEACAVPRSAALISPDPMVVAAEGQARVTVLDFTDYFCDAESCATAIGGVVAYRDTHHITATLATTFGPVIGRELDRLGF